MRRCGEVGVGGKVRADGEGTWADARCGDNWTGGAVRAAAGGSLLHVWAVLVFFFGVCAPCNVAPNAGYPWGVLRWEASFGKGTTEGP